MHSSSLLLSLLIGLSAVNSAVVPNGNDRAGYLLTTFPFEDEAIYMYISHGNDPLRWDNLPGHAGNGSILRSNVGSNGVRDSQLVSSPDGTQHWLLATDLQVNAIQGDFNEATRFGSRKIVVWESQDLIEWTGGQLSPDLVPTAAGNAWAPEGYFDALIGKYVIVFAARFWSDSDPQRTGPQPPNKLMYVTTTDFKTFSEAKTYLDPGYPVIDATFLHATEQGPDTWHRWVKDERDYTIYQQRSSNGILGEWSNVGGAPNTERITFASQFVNNEGPLIFRDNVSPSLYHLWIDNNSIQSYISATASTLDNMKAWKAESRDDFPAHIKHGSVTTLTKSQYDAIRAKYFSK